MRYIDKEGCDPRKLLVAAVGSLIGIGGLAFLSVEQGVPLLAASFGATAVLIYSIPKSPLARPRNVFFGHLISAVIGVACSVLLGSTWYAMAIAVTFAIVAMNITGTLHPPGGATALICVLYSASWSFIIAPVMIGVAFMMIVAYGVNKADAYLDDKHNASADSAADL